MNRHGLLALGVVLVWGTAGCKHSEEGGSGSTASGASTGTTGAPDSTDSGDSDVLYPDFGTSEYCSTRTEEECRELDLNGGPCLLVIGAPVIQHDGWYCTLENEGVYLGCIDLANKGCGVEYVCKDGKKWLIGSFDDCVPAGFDQCDAPEGEGKDETSC